MVDTKMIGTVITSIIGVTVIIAAGSELVKELQSSGNQVVSTSAPLSGLFSGDGVVPLLALTFLLITVFALSADFLLNRKRRA